jgi:hypothetical protein
MQPVSLLNMARKSMPTVSLCLQCAFYLLIIYKDQDEWNIFTCEERSRKLRIVKFFLKSGAVVFAEGML